MRHKTVMDAKFSGACLISPTWFALPVAFAYLISPFSSRQVVKVNLGCAVRQAWIRILLIPHISCESLRKLLAIVSLRS